MERFTVGVDEATHKIINKYAKADDRSSRNWLKRHFAQWDAIHGKELERSTIKAITSYTNDPQP